MSRAAKERRAHRPRREALPTHLPRVAVHHEPESKSCDCGYALTRIGEDISEKLAYEPGVFRMEPRRPFEFPPPVARSNSPGCAGRMNCYRDLGLRASFSAASLSR